MLESISYYQIFGLPVVIYLGIVSILLLFTTAFVGFMSLKGRAGFTFQKHKRLAVVTIIFAVAHGFLVLMARL